MFALNDRAVNEWTDAEYLDETAQLEDDGEAPVKSDKPTVVARQTFVFSATISKEVVAAQGKQKSKSKDVKGANTFGTLFLDEVASNVRPIDEED
jgi:hypothetical protein